MATLTNTKIKDTYDGLLKTTDNDVIGITEKVITDGLGNASILSIGTQSASFSEDIQINGQTFGVGGGSVASNIAIGNSPLSSNTTGTWNIALGENALSSNTIGTSNIALGTSSLASITNGSSNVAIGVAPLQYIDGNQNVAIGFRAGADLFGGANKTAGGYNVYIGSLTYSGAADTDNEIVIGYAAIGNGSNTATYGNASITDHYFNGDVRADNNTITAKELIAKGGLGNGIRIWEGNNYLSSNISIGGNSNLSSITTGSNNTAIGGSAGTNITTGSQNVSLGSETLGGVTTGSRNMALGFNALLNINGNDNVGIGFRAGADYDNGVTSGDKTLGDQNIYIGTYTVSKEQDTDNEIVIGFGATGNGSNTATYGNASITGHHFTAGQVNVSGNLAVDTNTLYVDAADNWVGIGTTTRLDSATKFQITANSSGVTSFSGGADDVIIEHNTNVGLTLASPNNAIASIYFTDPDRVNSGFLEYSHINDNFRIQVNGGEAMRIDSSGNVGIGTLSVDSKVHIESAFTPSASAQQLKIENTTTGQPSVLGMFAVADNGGAGNAGAIYFDAGADGSSSNNILAFNADHQSDNNYDLVLTGSGNVGIGTSSPAVKLEVNSGTDNGVALFESTDSAAYIDIKDNTGYGRIVSGNSGDMWFSPNGGEAMRIDSSGNVGINKSPENFAQLEVKADTNGKAALLLDSNATTQDAYIQYEVGGSSGWEVGMKGSGSSYGYVFSYGDIGTASNERMRITSGGGVMIGKQSLSASSTGFEVEASGIARITKSSDFPLLLNRLTTEGAITSIRYNSSPVGSISVTASSTAYNTSSDYRLKENVVEMTGALDRVDALKPSRFNFIADPEKTVDGFLAHEVAEVVPEAVTGEKDAVDEDGNPIYQGIDQSKIVPLLVGAIKELRAEIELLKAK